MAFQPVQDVLRVTMTYNLVAGGGKPMENIYHTSFGSTPVAQNLADVAAAFIEWETNTACHNRSDEVRLVACRVIDLSAEFGLATGGLLDTPVAGTHPSPILPTNVSIALHWPSAGRGRGRSGRTYLIGLAEDQVDRNQLHTDVATAWITDYNSLITSLTAVGATLCIVHYPTAAHPGFTPTSEPALAPGFRDLTLDSRRLRLDGERKRKRRAQSPLTPAVP